MNYLLDTNVLSELRRPRQADRRVLDWFAARDSLSTFISAITIAELEYGAALAAYRQKPHALLLRSWIDDLILPGFAGRIVPVDEAVAIRYAHFQVPESRFFADVMIGATAQVHGLTVVTRNTADFARFAVPMINPWSTP